MIKTYETYVFDKILTLVNKIWRKIYKALPGTFLKKKLEIFLY